VLLQTKVCATSYRLKVCATYRLSLCCFARQIENPLPDSGHWQRVFRIPGVSFSTTLGSRPRTRCLRAYDGWHDDVRHGGVSC